MSTTPYVCIFAFSELTNLFFFFNDTAPTEIYTLSLHDALPICRDFALRPLHRTRLRARRVQDRQDVAAAHDDDLRLELDRKSTRLNSSHVRISYAVFCLKKKKRLNASAASLNFNNYPHSFRNHH